MSRDVCSFWNFTNFTLYHNSNVTFFPLTLVFFHSVVIKSSTSGPPEIYHVSWTSWHHWWWTLVLICLVLVNLGFDMFGFEWRWNHQERSRGGVSSHARSSCVWNTKLLEETPFNGTHFRHGLWKTKTNSSKPMIIATPMMTHQDNTNKVLSLKFLVRYLVFVSLIYFFAGYTVYREVSSPFVTWFLWIVHDCHVSVDVREWNWLSRQLVFRVVWLLFGHHDLCRLQRTLRQLTEGHPYPHRRSGSM